MFLKSSKFFFLLIILVSYITSNASINSIHVGIEKIIQQTQLPAAIGIEIQDMQNGQVLYKKNSDQLFVPASNLKIFTAITSLIYLLPDYTFKTALLTDGVSSNGNLNGNVYLKFSGDPTLTSEEINTLISNLVLNNIKTINGNFYVDSSVYKNKPYGPGWMWDELNICYAAPIAAMMIDQNCVTAMLTPAPALNQPALLSLATHLIRVKNQVKTVAPETSNCPLELTANKYNEYILSGCLAQNAKPINLQIAIKNPALYARNYIAALLEAKGIVLRGKILFERSPDNLTLIATQNSKPLATIVTEMMKQSNDPIANSLFLKIGENFYHQPVRWRQAAKAMRLILAQQTHVDLTQSAIVDGSGISRYNLVSAEQISHLLNFAYHDSTIAPYFLPSLPIAGKDGTLATRMTDKKFRGEIVAKTGTMSGVSALSGYVTTRHYETLSFVILINNFTNQDAKKAELLEDKICGFLAES